MAAEAAQPYVTGGVSAMIASVCIHPLDLAKVRLQLMGQGQVGVERPNALRLLGTMVRTQGISSVYAGLSAALVRQATYGTARIGLHTEFSRQFQKLNGGKSLPFWQKTAASMLGGGVAVMIGTPFDVALVRMQADSMKPVAERRNYKNAIDAVFRIGRDEGVTQLWRGLSPNVLRGMAMNAGMMAFYDQAKEMTVEYVTKDPNPAQPSMPTQLVASGVAGFMCAFLSLPFDLLKSRLQDMKKLPDGTMPYKGVLDCAGKTLSKEGVLAFWRGFGAYYGRCAPHAMIILLTREQVMNAYRVMFLSH